MPTSEDSETEITRPPSIFFVLKYDSNGNRVWTQRWTNPITNYSAYAYSIAVDNQGNVFTTGFMSDGFTDGEFVTLKFNSSGALQWATPYNGSTSSIDYANCIVVDSEGNSYITGWSGGANNLHDFTTIKYASNGDEIWIRHYDGPANGYDAGQAIAVDGAGNAYITGNHTTATGLECVTLKYSATGDLLWAAPFSGSDNDGVLISIALDDSANSYVSGFVFRGGASDFVTIKYDTDGVEQWGQLYDGPGNSYDGTYAIAVDNNRNVVVAGYSTGTGTDYDYTTIKYSESATPTPTPTVTPSVTPTPTPSATPAPRPTLSPRPRPTPRPRP
jgi:Beta-propeller repeat